MIQLLKKWRCALVTWSTHQLALPVIRLIAKLPKFPYSVEQVCAMEPGTLGASLHEFLAAHHLGLLADYEAHDIKHALLGYPATEEGEASLQYFFLGNGQRSFPVLITVFVTFFIMPEYRQSFKRAWRRGKDTPRLGGVDWFSLLPLDVEMVRHNLKIASL